jgi:hypothetical protein
MQSGAFLLDELLRISGLGQGRNMTIIQLIRRTGC